MTTTTEVHQLQILTGRKLVVFRWAVRLFAFVVGLGLAEATARLLQLAPPIYPEADTAIVLHYTDPNGLIKLTPNWKGYVGYAWTEINSHGFRDRDYAPEPPPGTVRFAVLGDSYAMGDAVPLEATFSKRLEMLLRRGHRCEVLNCGVSATNTLNQFQILREVLHEFHPNVVLLSYNINDFQFYRETRFDRLARSGYSFNVLPDGRVKVSHNLWGSSRAKLWVRDHSYFYRWLANFWNRVDHAGANYDDLKRVQSWVEDPIGPSKSFEALGQMKELCNEQGVSLFVFILPDLVSTPPHIRNMDDYPYRKEHELIHVQLKALGVEFVDLLPEFAGEETKALEAHPFDHHYSARGNEIIASALAKHLEPKLAAMEKQLSDE